MGKQLVSSVFNHARSSLALVRPPAAAAIRRSCYGNTALGQAVRRPRRLLSC